MKAGFWKAIVFILTGVIIGLIGADKLGMGVKAVYNGKFRFKQKGDGNVLDADVSIETPTVSPKAERILERLEKRKDKARKRINKSARKEKRGES